MMRGTMKAADGMKSSQIPVLNSYQIVRSHQTGILIQGLTKVVKTTFPTTGRIMVSKAKARITSQVMANLTTLLITGRIRVSKATSPLITARNMDSQVSLSQTNPLTASQVSRSQTNPLTAGQVSRSQTNPLTASQVSLSQTNPLTAGQVSRSQTNPLTAGRTKDSPARFLTASHRDKAGVLTASHRDKAGVLTAKNKMVLNTRRRTVRRSEVLSAE